MESKLLELLCLAYSVDFIFSYIITRLQFRFLPWLSGNWEFMNWNLPHCIIHHLYSCLKLQSTSYRSTSEIYPRSCSASCRLVFRWLDLWVYPRLRYRLQYHCHPLLLLSDHTYSPLKSMNFGFLINIICI